MNILIIEVVQRKAAEMNLYLEIVDVRGREILDSRGNPTVEAEVTVKNHRDGMLYTAVASVPSGASTGKFEAVELRDAEERYFGLGVQKAVENINTKILPLLIGKNALNQMAIDHILIDADGTENKVNLGANATLGVSLACARAAACALNLPLYRYLGGVHSYLMPIPMMNILNGGKHADNIVDFQEFMIMPIKTKRFREALRICAEIYHHLKKLLEAEGMSTSVGDEGGFAPNLPDAETVLDYIMEAINLAGYRAGEEVGIALDVAASELYREDTKDYYFPGESSLKGQEVIRTTKEMISYYERLIAKYPIFSIEDGLSEEDWDGFQVLTRKLGEKVQLVGDDLFVTNVKRLHAGIQLKAGNAILIKVNQIGTLSEATDAVELALKNGYRAIISHRSGETEDTFIADLAVALNVGQIKTGAPCRGERVAKYNRLLKIEEEL